MQSQVNEHHITNLQYPFVTEKEIGSFEISVNDPVVMEMSHTFQ